MTQWSTDLKQKSDRQQSYKAWLVKEISIFRVPKWLKYFVSRTVYHKSGNNRRSFSRMWNMITLSTLARVGGRDMHSDRI